MGVGGGEKVAKWACQNEMGSLLWLRRPLWNRRARSEALPRSGRRMKEKWTHMYSTVKWVGRFSVGPWHSRPAAAALLYTRTLFFFLLPKLDAAKLTRKAGQHWQNRKEL